jgi:hypothetical protein
VKESPFEPPAGVTTIALGGDAKDGKPAAEFVYAENVGGVGEGPAALREANKPSEEVKNQIF